MDEPLPSPTPEAAERDVHPEAKPEPEATSVSEKAPVPAETEIAEISNTTPSNSPPRVQATYPPPPSSNLPPPPPTAVLVPDQPVASTSAAAPKPSPPTEIPSSSTVSRPNPRFRFFRRKQRRDAKPSSPQAVTEKGEGDAEGEDQDDEEDILASWDAQYEKSSLPFVRLENNRAACAICLMDFDEPPKRKVKGHAKSKSKDKAGVKGKPATTPEIVEEVPVAPTDPPEPLRLLECGHVFHVRLPLLFVLLFCSLVADNVIQQKSCLDPWLTGVSGRCPTCQRKVEILPKGKHRANANANAESLV